MTAEFTLKMRQPHLEKLDTVQQRTNGFADGIRHQMMLEIDPSSRQAASFDSVFYDTARYSDDCYARRNIRNDDRVGSNPGPGSDCNRPKDLGAAANEDTVFKSRMPLAWLP